MNRCFDDAAVNVVALVKGRERYVFCYDDASRSETIRTIGRFAANAQLTLNWYDAAVLVRQISKEAVQ